MRRLTSHVLLLTVAWACARVQAPPGGPPDLAPPLIVSTGPDSAGVSAEFDEEVEFRFNEVVSEGGQPNFGLGTGDLEKLVILSPSLAVPEVRWRRTRITVKPREGWKPNTVYRIELLPGLADLSNNRMKTGGLITFATGGTPPRDTLRGLVVDWTTQRPLARGLVEAVLQPDSLPYRTLADSLGRFILGPLPRGEYLVYGVIDQNADFRRGARESFDSIRIAPGRDSVGELWAFRHDTTGARVTVTPNDTLSLALTFSQPLNPYQVLPADSVTLLQLPDSTRVPVLRLLPKQEYDSVFRPVAPVDTSAAGRAKADSIRTDSIARAKADSIRADSIARAQEAVRIRLPGERRRPPAADTAGRGPLKPRPPLNDRLVIRVGERLKPGSTYLVVVHGVENLSRIAGSPSGVVKIPEAKPPPDSAKAKPDTAAAPRKPRR